MTHLASGYPKNARRAICGAYVSNGTWRSNSTQVTCGACLAKNATSPPGKKWEG